MTYMKNYITFLAMRWTASDGVTQDTNHVTGWQACGGDWPPSGIGLAAAVALGEAGADVMLIAWRAAL